MFVTDRVKCQGRPPFVCRIHRGTAILFEQADSCSVCFQIGGIAHHSLPGLGAPGQIAEDHVETLGPSPGHKAIVQRLVQTMRCRRILPLQASSNHVNDPTDHPSIIHTRLPLRRRKMTLNHVQLIFGSTEISFP